MFVCLYVFSRYFIFIFLVLFPVCSRLYICCLKRLLKDLLANIAISEAKLKSPITCILCLIVFVIISLVVDLSQTSP